MKMAKSKQRITGDTQSACHYPHGILGRPAGFLNRRLDIEAFSVTLPVCPMCLAILKGGHQVIPTLATHKRLPNFDRVELNAVFCSPHGLSNSRDVRVN
jgi:hypothetical protein